MRCSTKPIWRGRLPRPGDSPRRRIDAEENLTTEGTKITNRARFIEKKFHHESDEEHEEKDIAAEDAENAKCKARRAVPSGKTFVAFVYFVVGNFPSGMARVNLKMDKP
jgi:hypothetical protein